MDIGEYSIACMQVDLYVIKAKQYITNSITYCFEFFIWSHQSLTSNIWNTANRNYNILLSKHVSSDHICLILLKFLWPEVYFCFPISSNTTKPQFYLIITRNETFIITNLLSDLVKLHTWFRATLLACIASFSMSILRLSENRCECRYKISYNQGR